MKEENATQSVVYTRTAAGPAISYNYRVKVTKKIINFTRISNGRNPKQKFIKRHMWQNTDINMKMETNILHCIPNQENSLDISIPKLQKL